MICNLSAESFCIFGRIPGQGENPVRANRHSISLSPNSSWTYRAASQTWVCGENGTVILSVSTDGEHYRDFFLERPVVIRDGIRFKLTALREVACVQIGGVILPTLEKTGAASSKLVAKPQLQIHRIYSLFYQEKEAGFLFPGESHSAAELVYVDSGSIHSVAEGQELQLQQGDMVLYEPEQWHMQYAQPECAPRLVSIQFDGEGLDLQRFAGRKITPSPQVVQILQRMLWEQDKMDAYSEDMIFALLAQMLLLLQREDIPQRKTEQIPHHNQNENEIVRRAQQYIGQNVCSKLSVPVVAQGVDVSASYLTALFQKHMQITPAEYIRRIKLQKGKQLIREGKLNFTEIAQALEYSTVHHFSRQFKEKFGITPTEYARTVRQEV